MIIVGGLLLNTDRFVCYDVWFHLLISSIFNRELEQCDFFA